LIDFKNEKFSLKICLLIAILFCVLVYIGEYEAPMEIKSVETVVVPILGIQTLRVQEKNTLVNTGMEKGTDKAPLPMRMEVNTLANIRMA
jgi:hypothetical protein